MTWGPDVDHLPYGVGRATGCLARLGDHGIDLAKALDDPVFAQRSLNGFMARGPQAWRDTRQQLLDLLAGPPRPDLLVPLDQVALVLPWQPADYVDFYASEAHATNLGRMFRPDAEPLLPNW